MFKPLLLSTLAAAALTLSACGDDEKTSSPSTEAATTATQSSTGTAAVDGKITIIGTEMKFTPSVITASAGKLTITLDNKGTMEHELVVLKTDTPADQLAVTDNEVAEDDSVGEIAEIAAGKSASHTFDLKPGKYVIVCNVPGHYAAGMRGTLIVK